MRKIWTRRHVRYFAFAMAIIVGLLPPCAALAAEEDTTEEDTREEETDSEGEEDVTYITAFEPLAEEDALLSCMEKPELEELTDLFPETLLAWTEGEEESTEIEVSWESDEDFEETKLESYTFYPKWDETLYAIAESAEDSIEIPFITVEVPVEKGMIPELEEAKNDLQEIIENKSILALVYLCDEYEVKSEPSADGETVHTVVSGQSVQITDVELDENGSVWYETFFYQNGSEYTGYIERGYLAASDEDFMQWEETYIELPPAPKMMRSRRAVVSYPDVDQFPDSYQNALYELKAKHPNWIFVRMDTGIDWNTAISKEMGDKSLVHSSSPGSWQNGVYGQGWCYASEGILKYFMDPRNFLTDPAIFQFEQLTYNDSYHTAEAVQEILKNSFMSSTIPGDSRTYAQAFTAIGQSTGVSPFHLASRVLQEQGTKGTSALISGTYSEYEGYYNYFNVSASGKTNAEVIVNGLKKAKEQGWNTRYKSLNGGAKLIGANYILKGQDTLYLEKFNVSKGQHANFTHQYMQNIQAPNSEASNIQKAYNNAGALENSFVFKIPVYRNMPASACSKPGTTDTITLDKTTASLRVDETVKLVPYINGSKVDYISNMTFSSDDPSVATVDSVGKVTAVSPGNAVISCTRSGTGTAVCTVTVVKADLDVSTPTLSPCTYREGMQLKDISLPDGWKWTNENTKIEVGTNSYEAVYTPEDSVKYNTITRSLGITVTKAIPDCTMPEGPKVFTGSTLGEITLPDGFVWESDTETELREPGEFTFYVSYNPDEENYYPVSHIPFIVQVIGEASKPDEGEGTGTGSGTSSGGSTGTGSGSGTTSGSSTSSGGSSTTSGGSTSSGGSTGTGSGSSTTSGSSTSSSGSTGTGSGTTSGGSTSSGGSTGTGSGSGTTSGSSTSSGGSTGSGSSTTSGSSTSSGGSTGTGSGSGTTSGGSTSSGGSTGTGSGSGTTSGSSTSSGGSSTTSGGSTSSSGSTGTGSSSAASGTGSSNAGAPLKELPKDTATSEDRKTDSGSGSNKTAQEESTGGQQTSPSADSQSAQGGSGGSNQQTQTASGGSQPTQESSGNSQSAENVTDSNQSPQNAAETGQNRQSDHRSVKESTETQSQTQAAEEAPTQEPGAEESISKPAVTMDMEDTTILTPEKLQMAKDQNLDLVLNMGKYATWSIDIDTVDLDTVTDVDMGIELGTENIPTEIIADILDGNQYLEFTLAHDGLFGFQPILQIALNPIYEGWYANLFYYNEEAESLEFICDAMIDSSGIAVFNMEHASSYVIIVSPVSMADADVSSGSENHAARWLIIGLLICIIAAGVGGGVFFYRKRMQEDGEEEEANEEEYEEVEDEYEEAIVEEEYEEANEEHEEAEEECEEAEGEYEEAEEECDEANEEHEHNDEDDWIEDEDWQEPETEMPESASTEGIADDHAEDDWIDDDEWDISNDWIDDAEWEKRKEA